MLPALVPLPPAVVLPNFSHAVDSCRVDWLSATFQLHRDEDLDAIADYLADLGGKVLPGGRFSEPARGRFYETKHRHESGIQFQYTLPSSSASVRTGQESTPVLNSGLCSIELPGSIFGALCVEERRDLLVTIRRWPGMKRVTRMDLQLTQLNPEQDAEAICIDVRDRRLWPVGFGVQMAYAYGNLHGDFHGACTQYFGGKTSRVRYRGYDKAAEAGWPVPAVRHEVQLREEPADQHFRRLAERCENDQPAGPLLMSAEAVTVRDALGTLVDFRDISRWKGRPLPKKWAQTAKKPGWWRDLIGDAPDPLEIEYRRPEGLEGACAAGVDQYGRTFALYAFLGALRTGDDLEAVAMHLLMRFLARSAEKDAATLCELEPAGDHAQITEDWRRLVAIAQNWALQEGGFDDTAPPC